MTITKDIKYIGVNDHEIDLFECTKSQGIDQMRTFVDEIVGQDGG